MKRSLIVVLTITFFASLISILALPANASDSKTVRIYMDGEEQVVSTKADTVGEVLNRVDIDRDETDLVEPSEDTKIAESGFHINVYRARPVMVIDGKDEYKIATAHQSPELIAEAAGLTVYKQDLFKLETVTDFIDEEFIGQKLTIDRATPVNLLFDGQKISVRTQLETVGELIDDQGIKVGDKDTINHDDDTRLTNNMDVIVTRVGKKVVTVEEDIAFNEKVIYDNSQPISYNQVQQAGKPGKRVVTYELVLNDGKEVKRTTLQSVVKSEPVEQIVKRGNKTSGFDGSFSQALAKLRSCEGSYTSNSGNGYYGAYQFDIGTWGGYGGYSNASQAPPAVQDQKAWETYKARGWSPWPSCSAGLGLQDIYR